MSEKEKPESVWVQPTKGVYCELQYGDMVYKVWKVHPSTPDRFGTQIPYDIAVYYLGKAPPLITLVPEIKNGKHTTPLLKEDIDKIQESLKRGFVGGIKNYNEVSQPPASAVADAGATDALRQALDLLAKQTEANQSLQESLAKLQEQVTKLEQGAAVVPPAQAIPDPDAPPVTPSQA
jgi:hypothetical protein